MYSFGIGGLHPKHISYPIHTVKYTLNRCTLVCQISSSRMLNHHQHDMIWNPKAFTNATILPIFGGENSHRATHNHVMGPVDLLNCNVKKGLCFYIFIKTCIYDIYIYRFRLGSPNLEMSYSYWWLLLGRGSASHVYTTIQDARLLWGILGYVFQS